MKTFFSGVAVVVLCCAGLRPGRQRARSALGLVAAMPSE
jgi:hypothetical protein